MMSPPVGIISLYFFEITFSSHMFDDLMGANDGLCFQCGNYIGDEDKVDKYNHQSFCGSETGQSSCLSDYLNDLKESQASKKQAEENQKLARLQWFDNLGSLGKVEKKKEKKRVRFLQDTFPDNQFLGLFKQGRKAPEGSL